MTARRLPPVGAVLAASLLALWGCVSPAVRDADRRLKAVDRALHRGRLGEAERSLEAARAAGASSAARLAELKRLEGELSLLQGRPVDSLRAFDAALAASEKAYGPAAPEAAAARLDVADAHAAAGEAREAERLYRVAAGSQAAGGLLAERLSELALGAQTRGRAGEAERLYREAAEATEKAYGKADPLTAARLSDWGLQLQRMGRLSDAEGVYRRALGIVEKAFAPGHPRRDAALNALALFLEAHGRYPEAEELYRRALKEAAARRSEAGRNYGSLLRRLGRGAEAAAVEAQARTGAP
jgi:hypothetical protein